MISVLLVSILSGFAWAQEGLNPREAFDAFNEEHDEQWLVFWDETTGTPARISGYHLGIEGELTAESAPATLTSVLLQYQDVLGITESQLARPKISHEAMEESTGRWKAVFLQQYRELPVVGGHALLMVSDQKLTMMGAVFYRVTDVPTEPELSARDSYDKARIRGGFPDRPARSRLVILPLGREASLAWEFVLPPTTEVVQELDPRTGEQTETVQRVQWMVHVDAMTGAVLQSQNLIKSADLEGDVTIHVRPKHPNDILVDEDVSDLIIDLNDGFQEAITRRGRYAFDHLLAGVHKLNVKMTGPHVEVVLGSGPISNLSRPWLPLAADHDIDLRHNDGSPDQVASNVFYHVNRVRKWFLRGGAFDVDTTPYPMKVMVRGDFSNAYAWSGGLEFGSDGDRDYGLCADIIYHEYTHRVVDALYSTIPRRPQMKAINEAVSDYFATSILEDPRLGAPCIEERNIDTPDRRYPEDIVLKEHTDGVILAGALWDLRKRLGKDYVDELVIRTLKREPKTFSSFLVELANVDDDPAVSRNPASNKKIGDGTPNLKAIARAFYDDHGIYHNALVGYTTTPVAEISSPSPTASFTVHNGTISITGSVGPSSGSVFKRFSIQHADLLNQRKWSTQGITLTGGGTTAVTSGRLATWSSAGVPDGLRVLRLRVEDDSGAITETDTWVLVDRQLRIAETGKRFPSSAVVAELNSASDGLEYAAIAYDPESQDNTIIVWNADGSEYSRGYVGRGLYRSSPAVGDVDNDGVAEIVVAGPKNYLWVMSNDAKSDRWIMRYGKNRTSTPALEDLDGDNDLEVAVGADSSLYIWHHDESSIGNWPVKLGGKVEVSPAIGNIDGAGRPEVVVSASDAKVYAFRWDGRPLAGWPIKVSANVSSSPVLGDVDADGVLEVVAASEDGNLYVWNPDGTAQAGWPKKIGEKVQGVSSPALGNLDADGAPEIVVVTDRNNIVALNGDGTPVPGWPRRNRTFYWTSWNASPIIADVDSDSQVEIVAEVDPIEVGNRDYVRLYVFEKNSRISKGWPRYLSRSGSAPPLGTDLDGDGDAEVIVGALGLFVYDLDSGGNAPSLSQWPSFRKSAQRVGTY